MNGRQKSSDEPNTKLLRELTNLPANKYCFDCGQRGPTYVNVTIGSFVCMSCSGLLRGLTPPHRVKSISMASFTADEIELLKNRGNEYCRRVWLATCSAKDSHLGSERDPDRMNLLRNFMSSKYEQKRFYVDPSRLPRGELAEIQAQTARALSLMATSKSGSLNSGSSTQKSPSLSSTRSSSSLQSNPSPSLSNGRRSADIASQQGFGFGPNRLVSSVTLPDIKPLSALMGPSVPPLVASGNQNDLSALSANPNAIDFISNLSSTTNQSSFASLKSSTSQQRNFLQQDNDNQHNFANFEDAFKNNEFTIPAPPSVSGNPGFVASFDNADSFGAFGQSSSPAFSQLNNPLVPTNNNVSGSNHTTLGKTPATTAPAQDKYAALKDLDSLFKQTSDDGSTFNGFPVGSPANNTGLSSSLSVPANLSNSAGSAAWFSTSPIQNPFSQVSAQTQDPQINGWPSQNGLGIAENGNGAGVNITNPFASESSNGWKNGPPASSPNQRFCAPVTSHGGFGTNFGHSNGISSFGDRNIGSTPPSFNPFFGTGSKSNPHNPFL